MTIHQSGTKLSGTEMATLEARELSEMEKIRAFFKSRPDQNFTAEEVHTEIKTVNLLTSTRRCLTDLKTEGFLKKNEINKKEGSYGVRLATYSYVTNPSQLKLL